jgi:hypothetical protein
MADSRGGLLRSVTPILLLGGTALGLYNVYGDNDDVKELAKVEACGHRPCDATITRESRSPLSQKFTFQTKLIEKGKTDRSASVDVECQRSAYLVGGYSCVAQGVLPP